MDKQVDLGKYTDLFNEIIDFLNSGALLKQHEGEVSDQRIIFDIDRAKMMAWESVYGEEELTWSDFRSDKMSEIWDIIYTSSEVFPDVENILASQLDNLNQCVLNQLSLEHKELLDDIVSDLFACMHSRVVLGKKNIFFEKIFSVYLQGGWPCGFESNGHINNLVFYKKVN
ncbi:hypothetical protein [uncultured Shewanella sp.]|uniref:hypothetical protein n=1 Tax=uncultured Shewanella sp. TaxID=173975 RepID=UPI0026341189|nr:hypothetical protein [uncultured Shewanella sp.]